MLTHTIKTNNHPFGIPKTVIGFTNVAIGSQLLTMGIKHGALLEVVRKAPFGGGYYCKIDNIIFIGLRTQELDCILTESVNIL